MTNTSPSRKLNSQAPLPLPFYPATLVLLGSLMVVGAIVIGWFNREPEITAFFKWLNAAQAHPPLWLQVPETAEKFLLLPTLIFGLAVTAVMKASPRPRTWSRVIVVAVMGALTIRYVCWRSMATLHLSDPLNGVFSLGLLFMELMLIFSNGFQLYLVLKVKPRNREADFYEVAVREGRYTPRVDVLIPTYSEPAVILRRTIVGCQAMEYPYKQIYLLDDQHRPEIRALAEELGCHYITRPDNRHAKAGNLNHAISRTRAELIAVFDADFVPTKNFLMRTVGMFQDQSIALVQTQQGFYNADPVARNLGLEGVLTQEVEIFSRYYQPLRDGVETALCYGSSFVVRRRDLENAGGFITESLSEDYFTAVQLSASGQRVVYLNEVLSAGLSAENMAMHVSQRLRWARGTLQAFFIRSNPITIPGLSFLQRLAHLEGILQWFNSLFRVAFLLMPLAYSFWGILPLQISQGAWLYFFLPYYIVQLITFAWLNERSRSALVSDVYAVAQCFPVSLAVIKTLINPFSKGFKVTQKGLSSDRFVFNWKLAAPLILLAVAMVASLIRNIQFALMSSEEKLAALPITPDSIDSLGLAWIWSAYNLLMIMLALFVLLDVPKPDVYEWFKLRRTVRLTVNNQTSWGATTRLSEVGLAMQFTKPEFLKTLQFVTLEIPEEGLHLQGQITQLSYSEGIPIAQIQFQAIDSESQRKLIELLFCRPGQWHHKVSPGELQALIWLIKSAFCPRFFLRRADADAVFISQT